ncbi:uncharacterized protein LOC118407096 [Branchiostoma floridae]|uniref:Uncharacterized protein LOC118407096 n=1 Tax=Branchiostoma floridae TaxID=7739 RepID=A0A9J7KHJ5_BRAFL|nr:uncharacterized protein LOC118407096 [Branchiostoma floridae]
MPLLSPSLVLFLLMVTPKGINTAPIGINSNSNLQSDINSLKESVQKINGWVTQLHTEMKTIRGRFEGINELLSRMKPFQSQIAKLQAGQGELNSTISALHGSLEGMEQREYIERCESGLMETPYDGVFSTGSATGLRFLHLEATFSRAFRTIPMVTIGLAHVDHVLNTNIRVKARVLSATKTSLMVALGTWEDSLLYSASVHWMACA